MGPADRFLPKPQHPATNGAGVIVSTLLDNQINHIPIGQPESAIPTNCPQDNFGAESMTFEQTDWVRWESLRVNSSHHCSRIPLTQQIPRMSYKEKPNSWVDYSIDRNAVLGPCRGNVPDLHAYRISRIFTTCVGFYLFGSVTDLPSTVPSQGNPDIAQEHGVYPVNLTLIFYLDQVTNMQGSPVHSDIDDCNHGYELYKPVKVSIERIERDPSTPLQLLRVTARSSHLGFELTADGLEARAGRDAMELFKSRIGSGLS